MTPATRGVRGQVFAISDQHVGYKENREITEALRPESDEDWLLVAGDVSEKFEDIAWVLGLMAERFAKVIWSPGNHELWSHPSDPVTLRGVARYEALVEMCRGLGVLTPEDPYAVWEGGEKPVTIAPLFVLYDYSFRAPGTKNKEESLRYAMDTGIVCADEHLLYPDPYPSREEWCYARVAYTEKRLAAIDPAHDTVLVNHYPLVRDPTFVLRYPEFAQWCGTELTAGWHKQFRTITMVYGHLHIPRETWYDGVRFEEVSVGYPREWKARIPREPLRRILPLKA
jgi:3',5'-cyclic AMP phosphodiesterase CpdA